jgi:hypothetical protein
MPRIPDAELDRIKRDIPIARLAAAHGVVLKPSNSRGEIGDVVEFME